MRDCIFLVADSNMEAAFNGFLGREQFHLSLQCGPFEFDSRKDLVVASGDNDPGLYTRAHELLRPYTTTHAHAVVVLDSEWEGSPGSDAILTHITSQLLSSGWNEDNCKVIVIDPELENWIWQKNPHVARALGLESASHFTSIISSAEWPENQNKPNQPKEVLERILEEKRIPRSSSIYRNITSKVSINGCQDDAFLLLKTTLQNWFSYEVSL